MIIEPCNMFMSILILLFVSATQASNVVRQTGQYRYNFDNRKLGFSGTSVVERTIYNVSINVTDLAACLGLGLDEIDIRYDNNYTLTLHPGNQSTFVEEDWMRCLVELNVSTLVDFSDNSWYSELERIYPVGDYVSFRSYSDNFVNGPPRPGNNNDLKEQLCCDGFTRGAYFNSDRDCTYSETFKHGTFIGHVDVTHIALKL